MALPDTIDKLQAALRQAQSRVRELEAENAKLKRLLDKANSATRREPSPDLLDPYAY